MKSSRWLRPNLILLLLFPSGLRGAAENAPDLKMDQALLSFQNLLPEEMRVFYTSDFCYKCVFQHLASIGAGSNSSVIVSTQFTLTVQVESQNRNATLCRWSQTYEEAGHYSTRIQNLALTGPACLHFVDKSPNNAFLHAAVRSLSTRTAALIGQALYEAGASWSTDVATKVVTSSSSTILAAALLLALTWLLFVAAPLLYRKHCTSKFIKTICCQVPPHSSDNGGAHVSETALHPDQSRPPRLLSLDTFRGFSLTVMVFVNYGGGGYWFFQHAPWNGLTVADLVMPWFVFIIGTSVVLAFTSMQRRGVGRPQLLRKITWRTVVLMLLGFCFLNYSPRDGPLSVSWLRIPGVLQRLGFTYFVLSLLQTFWGQKAIPVSEKHWWNPVQDVVLFWPQWLIVMLLETLWLCLTFLLPVPNCPTGYLGAGGIGDDGLYVNCTGGAAGYIDRWMFGDNMYRYPTCQKLYQTVQPFDPEGILGTINCIVMGFLGMQAGRILVRYKSKSVHILCRFGVWAVITGISAAILSKCTRDGGFIPVNKNLWSLSYVTCVSCFSFLLLGGMYFVIDVKGWWGGQPFLYPGMNSIFVYVGHSLLGFYFPFSWEIHFQDSHWELLLQNVWATTLWVLIAYLLYKKKFFLKI